jgi:glyoxylase-like metal-dependent hydrolase (beta-lactamase superfamily II)
VLSQGPGGALVASLEFSPRKLLKHRLQRATDQGERDVPASMQGEILPAIYRFKLGGFEVTTIVDSKVIRPGLTPSFGGEQNADAVRALAKANRIDADRYSHNFTPLVVNTGKQLVLFDTGNGSLSAEHEQLKGRLPPGALVARMGEAGYKPEDVDVIVLTHGHPDHIGGFTKGGAPVFPNARYAIGAADFDFWKKGENVREARKFNRELYVKIVVPLAERATFIKPGDEVVPGIRAVDAFGHSPGHMAFHIESDGKRMLNWADTGGHYVVSLQRPDLHLDVDDDKEKAAATRKRIFDMAADEDLLVAGFHMPSPGIGYVERAGGAYRWVPHGYQMSL